MRAIVGAPRRRQRASVHHRGSRMSRRARLGRRVHKLSLSIIRILSRSSRCAPKPPRASLIADFGEASRMHRRHRQRHRAEPVEPHRRQFFAAAGVGSAGRSAERQHSLMISRRVPPRDAQPSSACIARCVSTPARLSGNAARAFRRARHAAAIRRDRHRRRYAFIGSTSRGLQSISSGAVPSSGMMKSTDNAPCQPRCAPIFSR